MGKIRGNGGLLWRIWRSIERRAKITASDSMGGRGREHPVFFWTIDIIADCDILIAISNMKLGEKIRYLRLVEGTLRGLGREMTQQEIVKALAREMKRPLSQSYLSQIESGARPHLTNSTRMLLAKFFGVHPGYLVDDPEGFHTELISGVRVEEDQLDLWLISGAERFMRDREVSRSLLALARHADSRKCLMLLYSILDTPELVDRLLTVLRPAAKLKEAV